MRINLFNVSVLAASAVAVVLPLQSAFADADAARIARLEQRLLELEQRLADTEQETKEVKVLAASSSAGASNASILGNAATFDILAGSAWQPTLDSRRAVARCAPWHSRGGRDRTSWLPASLGRLAQAARG